MEEVKPAVYPPGSQRLAADFPHSWFYLQGRSNEENLVGNFNFRTIHAIHESPLNKKEKRPPPPLQNSFLAPNLLSAKLFPFAMF